MVRGLAALTLCVGLAAWIGCGSTTATMESAADNGMETMDEPVEGTTAVEEVKEAVEEVMAATEAIEAEAPEEPETAAKPKPTKPPVPAQPSLLAPGGSQTKKTEMEGPVTDEQAVVMTTSKGRIVIELYPDAAPEHVANFKKHINDRFYEGAARKFHRYVAGFVIQGGDPAGNGTGGPGYTVPAEIGLKHVQGSVAAARTGDAVNPKRESSGSQFYICLEDLPQLDGAYSVFGKVILGMDVAAKLRQGDNMTKLELRPREDYAEKE